MAPKARDQFDLDFLALLGRIDTDLKSLFIVDPKPVGDELLDHALQNRGRPTAASVTLKSSRAKPSKRSLPGLFWSDRAKLPGLTNGFHRREHLAPLRPLDPWVATRFGFATDPEVH